MAAVRCWPKSDHGPDSGELRLDVPRRDFLLRTGRESDAKAANGAHAESKAWLPMSLRPCPPSRCRSVREKAGKGVKTLTNHQDLEAEALLDLFGKHSLSAPMSAS